MSWKARTPKHVEQMWHDLQARRTQRLEPLRVRLHRTDADAAAEFNSTFGKDEVFMANPAMHIKRVQLQHREKLRTANSIAVAVESFRLIHQARQLTPALREFKAQARHAPSPVMAWADLVGADIAKLDVGAAALMDVAHQTTLLRLLTESISWQPSRVLDVYRRADAEMEDIATCRTAASIIQFIESRHGNGWSGPAPASQDEESAAVQLRKLIDFVQESRIPPAVAAMEQDIEAAASLVGKLNDLDRIQPTNPDHQPGTGEIADEQLRLERAYLASAEYQAIENRLARTGEQLAALAARRARRKAEQEGATQDDSAAGA